MSLRKRAKVANLDFAQLEAEPGNALSSQTNIFYEPRPVIPVATPACHTDSSSPENENEEDNMSPPQNAALRCSFQSPPCVPSGTVATPRDNPITPNVPASPGAKPIKRRFRYDDERTTTRKRPPPVPRKTTVPLVARPRQEPRTQSRYVHDYVEIGKISSGNFGSVMKCRQKVDGMEYAVKRVPINCRAGASSRRLAKKEIFAFAALEAHPHVVRYYQSWIEDSYIYIQLELCHSSLHNEIRDRRGKFFKEYRITYMLRQVALGLNHLHSNKLVHLDVKPENILIRSGIFKLGDLGMVTKVEGPDNSQDDMQEGDVRFLAREVLRDNRDHLRAADMFSLGASVYSTMICRDLPKNGKEWNNIRDGFLRVRAAHSGASTIPSGDAADSAQSSDDDTADLSNFRLPEDAQSSSAATSSSLEVDPSWPVYSAKLVGLVKSMMHPNPEKRPSAREILKSDLLASEQELNLRRERAMNKALSSQLRANSKFHSAPRALLRRSFTS